MSQPGTSDPATLEAISAEDSTTAAQANTVNVVATSSTRPARWNFPRGRFPSLEVDADGVPIQAMYNVLKLGLDQDGVSRAYWNDEDPAIGKKIDGFSDISIQWLLDVPRRVLMSSNQRQITARQLEEIGGYLIREEGQVNRGVEAHRSAARLRCGVSGKARTLLGLGQLSSKEKIDTVEKMLETATSQQDQEEIARLKKALWNLKNKQPNHIGRRGVEQSELIRPISMKKLELNHDASKAKAQLLAHVRNVGNRWQLGLEDDEDAAIVLPEPSKEETGSAVPERPSLSFLY